MLDSALRITACQSPLALWQVYYVKDVLTANHPGLIVEPVPMVTRGDVIPDTPLTKVGGRGLFAKELEVMLLEKRIDIAVYSMKDMPVEFPDGLGLTTICEREDPRGAFVSNEYNLLDELPTSSIIGTSSLCRQCQLVKRRSDLVIRSLCGDVGTRLSKLDNGDCGAVILAVAGLKCLGLESRVHTTLPPEVSLLAVGRSAIGTECRLDDMRAQALLAPLNHEEIALRVKAERIMNTRPEGGCQVSIGSYAEIIDGETWLRALVGVSDGSQVVCGERHGVTQDAEQMGISLVEELLENSARAIPAEVYNGEAPARVFWSLVRLPQGKSQ